MENFEDTINQILCGAAVVSMIIGLIQHPFPDGMIEGTSILIALCIIIVVNSGNNWISERRLADLVNLSEKQEVAVYRNSTETITIDGADLVVGDLIKFEAGMKVPCDCIMVEGQDVACIEGELTGEPDQNVKTPVDEANFQNGALCTMLAKSLVCSGFGKAIVLAVGPYSVAGVITEKTQQAPQPTLLQEKLETIATKIGNVGIGCAVLTFLSMVIRVILEWNGLIYCGCGNLFTCEEPAAGTCDPFSWSLDMEKNRLWNEILNTVIIAITVIVVAIPEGLPLAVTISLSFSSAKMRKMNNLVRKLASSETMGGATHICSDKTGTLTLNKMTTMACMTCGEATYMPTAIPTSKLAEAITNRTSEVMINHSSIWSLLVQGVLWNSSARIEKNDGKDPNVVEEYVTKGNVTEQGLIKFFMGVLGGQGCVDERANLTEENTLCVISFTSSRKRASIVVRNPDQAGTDQEVRVYTKGAPDMLFDFTSSVVCPDGSIASLNDSTSVAPELLNAGESDTTDTHRGVFERTVKQFASRAYRTLLITYKDMSMDQYQTLKAQNNDFEKEADRQCLEEDLIAIGIFGLQDPLRGTIVDSIQKCYTAGIQVIMCTGDNIDTAIAISKNAGIVTEAQLAASEYTAMTGKVFREAVGGIKSAPHPTKKNETIDYVANMKKFREIKQNLRVLARSSPEDKYLLVTGIQDSEGVVAVTGDGTNDAPALTKADVGFSMGITGTDVAKGASDIILLDDNFSSIIVALRYGRNVYDNVRKFLQFQLTVNVVAMFIVFFGSVILKDSPLNAVQMLWVNLIMDTFAALALATEPPAWDILTRQPYPKNAAIVTELMWRNVFGHAIYQAIVLLVIVFAGPSMGLVKDYGISCLNLTVDPEDSTLKVCTEYNPFFAEGLYVDAKSQGYWEEKDLATSSFNQELLEEFQCNFYLENHLADFNSTNEFNCQDILDDANNGASTVTPKDLPTDWKTQKLLHYTFVFQIFVFMQLFNQINARKIELGEFNVFEGFFNNWLFIFVTIFTFAVQIFMVQVGGKAVKTYPLTTDQNLICLAFGAFELIWGVFVKFMPMKFFQCISLDETPIPEGTSTLAGSLKKSSVMQKRVASDLKKRVEAMKQTQQ